MTASKKLVLAGASNNSSLEVLKAFESFKFEKIFSRLLKIQLKMISVLFLMENNAKERKFFFPERRKVSIKALAERRQFSFSLLI